MKKLASILLILLLCFSLTGCGEDKESDEVDTADKKLVETVKVSIDELEENIKEDENYYQQYLGKAMIITGLYVDINEKTNTISFHKQGILSLTTIKCKNSKNLELTNQQAVTIKGYLTESALNSNYLYNLKDCSIE